MPVEFQRVVFDSLHQLTHPGVKAGMSLIKRSYWWQGIGCDVSKLTKACEACQKAVKRLKCTSIVNRCLNDYLLQANDLVTFTLILSVRSIRHAKGRTFCLQSLTDGLVAGCLPNVNTRRRGECKGMRTGIDTSVDCNVGRSRRYYFGSRTTVCI